MASTSTLSGPRAFFATTLARALELGVATPDDLLVHATPDVLSLHLPRGEWQKLIAACLAAPRTDARLVVDTVTVPVLCEHVPLPILWACLAQLAQRALGRGLVAPPPAMTAAAPVPAPVVAPPPAVAPAATPAAPPPRASTADERTVEASRPSAPPPAAPAAAPAPSPSPPSPAVAAPLPAAPATARTTTEGASRARTAEPAPLGDPPAPPRPGNGTPRTTLGARRPQAAAAIPARKPDGRAPAGRASTATDFEIETDLGDTWKKEPEQVDDDQLIDWSQNEETQTGEPLPGGKR